MKNRTKASLLITLLALCLLTGCAKSEWQYNPITDVNNLEGRRVGVNLAWESDYRLTDREDLELVRYDETADMIMALSYDKVDALGLDYMTCKIITNLSSGVKVSEPAGDIGYLMYCGSDDEELAEDFNRFLADFKQTPDYEEYVERVKRFDGVDYEGPDIPLTGTGKVLHVALDPTAFPFAFYDAGSHIPTGYDMELLKRFANDRGYQLTFAPSEYTGIVTGLQTGSYDIYTGYMAEDYAEEVKEIGLYVTDPHISLPFYFVQKTQERISADVAAME